MTEIARLRALLVGEFRISPARTALVGRPGRRLVVGRRFIVRGASRIHTHGGRLELGLLEQGFSHPRDTGLLRVKGRLDVHGNVRIGRGNRWDIGTGAQVSVGPETYFSADVLLVATTNVEVGSNCAIGWGTQILDDDFHLLRVAGHDRPRRGAVRLGDHVWVGSRVTLLRGTHVAAGSVIASNSVLRGDFPEPGSLIAGNPARVVRSGVEWS
jgi:acetyltransferase-like isoleucine patch superfamily enzyme